MLIRYGYEMAIVCPAPTPIVTQTRCSSGARASCGRETPFTTVPDVEASASIDMFGNLCRRFVAPSGRLLMSCHGVIEDDGKPDDVPDAPETPVAQLAG